MSGSVHRFPDPTPWHSSHDALDIAELIWKAGDNVKDHGLTLVDHPHDASVRAAARKEARKVIALCDRLEALSGPMGRQ